MIIEYFTYLVLSVIDYEAEVLYARQREAFFSYYRSVCVFCVKELAG